LVRDLLDKTICQLISLALGDEVGDLGSSPSWANIFLLLRSNARLFRPHVNVKLQLFYVAHVYAVLYNIDCSIDCFFFALVSYFVLFALLAFVCFTYFCLFYLLWFVLLVLVCFTCSRIYFGWGCTGLYIPYSERELFQLDYTPRDSVGHGLD